MSTALHLSPVVPRYLDVVEASLFRVLREAQLDEPRVGDADRAFRVLDAFVDCMAGYALGLVARQLAAAMRSWFGDAGTQTMRAAMHGWPCAVPAREVVRCDRVRPLAGEALARLRARFAFAIREARCLVDAIPAKPQTSVMFEALAQDDLAPRIADELALGWRVYVAAVTEAPYPPLSKLWQAWVWRLDGKPALTRDAVAEAGYIALVR